MLDIGDDICYPQVHIKLPRYNNHVQCYRKNNKKSQETKLNVKTDGKIGIHWQLMTSQIKRLELKIYIINQATNSSQDQAEI